MADEAVPTEGEQFGGYRKALEPKEISRSVLHMALAYMANNDPRLPFAVKSLKICFPNITVDETFKKELEEKLKNISKKKKNFLNQSPSTNRSDNMNFAIDSRFEMEDAIATLECVIAYMARNGLWLEETSSDVE